MENPQLEKFLSAEVKVSTSRMDGAESMDKSEDVPIVLQTRLFTSQLMVTETHDENLKTMSKNEVTEEE